MSDPTLKTEIHEQMTTAMKSGDKVRVGALRMLLAAIKTKEVEGAARELTDDEIRELAGKEVKKRTESIEAFEAAGRQELADKELAEREIIAAYAFEQLTDEAVDALVDRSIAETGATSMKEMGKVMSAVMAEAKGRTNGNVVQAKVKARLA